MFIKTIGQYGPLILILYSIFLLWNHHNLFFYYTIGIFVDSLLNIILKGIIQLPRPSEDPKLFNIALKNGKRFVFKNGMPHDIFGMPSGHAQSSFFSTVFIYLSLKQTNLLAIYLLISSITLWQRVVDNYHTLLQVIIGSIVGTIFGYFVYYLSQQKIKNRIREKKDDNAPI